MDNDCYFTVDFGCNFANPKRYPENKLSQLLTDSYNDGVDKCVSISNNIFESKLNLSLTTKYNNLYHTIGIHPHNASQFKEADIQFLESNINNSKCIAIGECGLDYNRMFSPKDKQIEVFNLQIDIAKKHNANLYLHCRDAYDDFISILKNKNYYKGIVHCFTGTLDQALELTSLGLKLGITGWLLDNRRNRDLVNAIKDKRITLDMLLIETDAPFMPIRLSKESIPSDTAYIVQEIARLKNIDEVKCGKILYKNAINFLEKKSVFVQDL